MELNIANTEVFWHVSDPLIGSFSPEISRPQGGTKLLGGAVSMDVDFIKDFSKMRVSKSLEFIGALKKLNDL